LIQLMQPAGKNKRYSTNLFMPQSDQKFNPLSLAHILFAAVLLGSFFLPWINWEGSLIKGTSLATGEFFKVSEEKFTIGNPFPQFSFSFYVFWLIPVLAAVTIILGLLKKKTAPFSYIPAALALSQFTVYYVFSDFLFSDQSIPGMLKIAAYTTVLAAIGLIITTMPSKGWLLKMAWILVGPVIAFGGYKIGEKMILSETHTDTAKIKADYTVTADALIQEFIANDTATNKKYMDKVLVVNGTASAVDILPDSTSTVRFADSTGSYAIFSLEKDQFEKTKSIKQGDAVSLKGVCSGSIFSEILKTTAITFKRATFNSTK
jgi:tRNA_anti-like